MSVVSNIAYLFRSYSSVYTNDADKYAKRIKLTNKSYDKLSERIRNSFATLHAEKREYREEVTKIEDELRELKTKMLESEDKLEKAKLKMEYNKKKIEHEVKTNLLPRKYKKIRKKMEKFVQGAREEAIRIESRRPIMVSENLENRVENVANMLGPMLGEEAVVTEIAPSNLVVDTNLNTDIGVELTEIQNEYNKVMEEAKNQESNVVVDSFVSDSVDKKMGTSESELVSEPIPDTDSIGQNGLNLMSEVESQNEQANLDSMFGVPQINEQDRTEVEIVQPRVAESPTVEEEIAPPPIVDFTPSIEENTQPTVIEAPTENLSGDQSLSSDNKNIEYNGMAELKIKYEQAMSSNDTKVLESIKAEMIKIAESKNSEAEKTHTEESATLKDTEQLIEEAKVVVTHALSNDITSLMNKITSLEEETAATMANTKVIKASNEKFKTLLDKAKNDKTDSNIAALNAMLSDTDFGSITATKGKAA